MGANYFSTVGLPVLRGRAFTEAEATQPGPRVAIIDEPLAKKLWPDGDALGQRVQYAAENTPSGQRGGGSASGTSAELSKEEKQDETIEIVGIVPVTRHDLFANEEPDGSIYLPFARGFQSDVSFFVRFRSLAPGTEASTADLLRRAVRDVDPSLPIISLQTFAQYLDSNLDLWLVRAGAALFSIFGGLALGLAVVGLYGVKAYSVARRTREIGIRMALGAQRGAVLRMIMREGFDHASLWHRAWPSSRCRGWKNTQRNLVRSWRTRSNRLYRRADVACHRRPRRDLATSPSRGHVKSGRSSSVRIDQQCKRFSKTFASASECFGAVPAFPCWRSFVSHSGSVRTRQC